jgi:hypothetical protein
MVIKRLGFILILFLLVSTLHGQIMKERLDEYTFKFAVYGPSDEIFIWWGHAALIIEHKRWNISWVYDWGIFSYPSGSFVNDFIKEQVQYMVTFGYLNMKEYFDEDRDIAVYTLDLDRKAKELILSYAEEKVLPENCYYDYHEFRDNCSTGVRDILDLGLRGQLKDAYGNVPGRFSMRQHISRYTWFRPFPDWFLGFLLGQNMDEKITPWDEMFLPVEIARNIVDFKYIDEFGAERKLVSSVQLLNSSKSRQPILNEPLVTWPFFFAAGMIITALIFFINTRQIRYPRFYRIFSGILQSILGLVLGVCGFILMWGLFFMNNDYFQQNANIFFVNPLLLFIVPLGILFAVNRKVFGINPERCLGIIWTCIFIAGSITVVLKVLPFFFQQNQSVYCSILPAAFALSNIPDNMYKLKSFLKKLRVFKHQKS